MKIAARVFLVALVALPVWATTVNFEPVELPGLVAGYGPDPYWTETPKGSSITDQYAAQGLLISMTSNGIDFLSNDVIYPVAGYPGLGQSLMFNTVPPYAQPEARLTLSFVLPTDSAQPMEVAGDTLSFFVCDTEWATNSVRVQTYGLDGNMIETWDLNSFGATKTFTTGAVSKIVFIDLGSDGFLLDTLSFTRYVPPPPPIPEPGTALLLGAGLAAAAALYRSKVV